MNHVSKKLPDLLNDVAIQTFGITRTDTLMKGICIKCKRPAKEHCHSIEGRTEYYISALCEECFDEIVNNK